MTKLVVGGVMGVRAAPGIALRRIVDNLWVTPLGAGCGDLAADPAGAWRWSVGGDFGGKRIKHIIL